MSYGICTLSIVPCRAEGSDRAELVTQLLFGEVYRVIEEDEKWIKIITDLDSYECWICRKQFREISAEEFDGLKKVEDGFTSLSELERVTDDTSGRAA